MKCTKCMKNTIIVDSRIPDDGRTFPASAKLIKETKRVWSWWSDDFRARRRRCQDCGYEFFTLEVELSDIEEALGEAANLAGGQTPWERTREESAFKDEGEADESLFH